MPRHSEDVDALLDRIGRRSIGLSVDDIAGVIAGALRDQRRDIVGHVNRLFKLVHNSNRWQQNETRFSNLHSRVTQLESELRILRKEKGGER